MSKVVKDLYIEFYPGINKYYAKLGNRFLKRDYYTGIIRAEDMIDIATQCTTEGEARDLCNLFLEQKTKENVKRIEI